MSAWYDGGCEIDKFVIQYRARGQQEWTLVSNNILREQNNVIIRDLAPASGYEILVSAQNHVGITEVKYRFTTLDLDGKQVGAGHSFLGNLPAFDEENDYSDDGIRRDPWPARDHHTSLRSLATLRHLLNSPVALFFSLCLFLALLVAFVLYKFNGPSTSTSSSIVNSSNKPNANGRHFGPEDSATVADLNEPPMSLANGSMSDSPRMNMLTLPLAECQYQPFCSATMARQPSSEYAVRLSSQECAPFLAGYGHSRNLEQFARLNRNTGVGLEPTDELGALDQGQDPCQQQQHSLMQMLMLGSQQQQQAAQESNQLDLGQNPYVAATLTRDKHNSAQKLASSQSAARYQTYTNPTLARRPVDYKQAQQIDAFTGKLAPTSNHQPAQPPGACDQSNNPLTAMTNESQTIRPAARRIEDAHAMSTFKWRQEPDQMAASKHTCNSSSSSASTSGRGTNSSASGQDNSDRRLLSSPQPLNNGVHIKEEESSPFIDSASNATELAPDSASGRTQTIGFSSCDRSFQYDVPFKFSGTAG